MEPVIRTHDTPFEVGVISSITSYQRYFMFLGALLVIICPIVANVAFSDVHLWLKALALISVLFIAAAGYVLAEPFIYDRPAYKLVKKELYKHYRLNVLSIENSGRFSAQVMTMSPTPLKVCGLMTLIENKDKGKSLRYRIDLFPE